jgi:hypothetical protein
MNGEIITIKEETKYTGVDDSGNEIPMKLNEDTGEIEAKNPHFVQFYKENFHIIRKLFRRNGFAGELFLFFTENMDKTNALIVSYQTLQEVYNDVCLRTIQRAIKYLKDNKYIDIKKSGNMNVYCVNASLVWQDYRTNIKYAKFNATVYLSENEQVKTKKVIHSEVKAKK